MALLVKKVNTSRHVAILQVNVKQVVCVTVAVTIEVKQVKNFQEREEDKRCRMRFADYLTNTCRQICPEGTTSTIVKERKSTLPEKNNEF